MKNPNRLKRVIIQRKLSKNEQKEWRLKLSNLARYNGIESLCLDDEELFIEFNPIKINADRINLELENIEFPANSLVSALLY